MAEIVRDRDGGDAIHRCLLVRRLRRSGKARVESVSGEREPHEKPSGAQVGRAGKPVADEVAHLWPAAEFLPAAGGDTAYPSRVAVAGPARAGRSAQYSTHAEIADLDERSVRQRHQDRKSVV